MQTLEWRRTQALDPSSVREIEDSTGLSLPTDYTSFILEHSEGRPSLKKFKSADGSEHVCNNLLSFDRGKSENVLKTFEYLKEELGRSDVFPFARDSFGNYICFAFDQTSAEVVFWQHETNSLEPVAKSFLEFLALLHNTE